MPPVHLTEKKFPVPALACIGASVGALLMLFAAAAKASPAAGEESSHLRQAIDDLGATFGLRYSRAADFRNRLASAASGASLEGLRREALLANPLVSERPILFVTRKQYTKGHHNTETFFPCAEHEFNSGRFTPGGALKVLDLASLGGQVRTLLDLPEGVVRDPEVHFSGTKILVSMRKNAADSYHIYEIGADGKGLRQLTFAKDVDDLDPAYLPDGSIVFSSTREPKYCGCNRHIMANLYRMEADGANVHQIGKSALFEGHSSLLPDGRILYDRWEYVDRNFGDAQGLWTINPDGTNPAIYWGNNTGSPGAVLDARAIPGTERVICTFSSCHDRPWGALAIVDRRLGLDGAEPVVRIWPTEAMKLVDVKGSFDAFKSVHPKYEDPYPLSDKYFLCSRMTGEGDRMGIYLLDVFGNELLLHAEKESLGSAAGAAQTEGFIGCFDPMTLTPRLGGSAMAERRDLSAGEGYLYVQDVYAGTHMAGVPRGEVKSLRVVEAPEKRFWTASAWGGQGTESPAMNWHNFENKRILGTVPVEADGSAYFEVPAGAFVYFQLLDGKGMMVQSMRSGTLVQPGEVASCTGCHESRRQAPHPGVGGSLALRRPPSRLEGWRGPARLFSYQAEVQPVFDRACVECHDFGGKGAAKLILARDRDLVFNASYIDLWRKGYLGAIGAGPAETRPAKSWGSSTSKLVAALFKCRQKYELSDEEIDRVITWIDLNAPYYPVYACAHPGNLAGRSPLDDSQLRRLQELTGVDFRKLADHHHSLGPQISFDRPEKSPCLASIPDPADPRRAEALTIIRAGQVELAKNPEPDAAGFRPCPLDNWREQKYEARRAREMANREAIREGRKVYDRPAANVLQGLQ